MKKYLTIIKTEIQRTVAQRVNLIGFRLAGLLNLSIQIIIWTVVLAGSTLVAGYNQQEMLTYVVVGFLFNFISATYGFESIVSRYIYEGKLSEILLKPISVFRYLLFLSFGRSYVGILSAMITSFIAVIIFYQQLLLSTDWQVYLLLVLMAIVSYLVRLFIAILIGSAAFWMTEVDGVRTTLMVFGKFFSGNYFPISLLPISLVKITMLLPFAYTFFVPIQIYLGKINIIDGWKALGFEILWLVCLYLITKTILRRGLKKYEAVGI